MARYRYSWANPKWKNLRASAQEIGDWYYSLENRDPDHVLKLARQKDCPIHDFIDWDDTTAARKYRASQINKIVSSLTIEIVDKNDKPKQIQAFIRSSETTFNTPIFEATEKTLDRHERQCIRKMEAFRARFGNIHIAQRVIESMNEVLRSASRKKSKLKVVKKVA